MKRNIEQNPPQITRIAFKATSKPGEPLSLLLAKLALQDHYPIEVPTRTWVWRRVHEAVPWVKVPRRVWTVKVHEQHNPPTIEE